MNKHTVRKRKSIDFLLFVVVVCNPAVQQNKR